MSSNVLARVAGWSGILSVIAFVVAIGLIASNSGKDSPLSTNLFQVSTVLLVPLFYALYVFFRSQAQAVALIALVLGLISFVTGVIAPTPASGAMLFNASSILGGVAIILFSYLGFQNAKMPRWLAILGVLLGILSILTAALGSIGQDILGLFLLLFFVGWVVWLSWLFLKGKLI